MKILFIGDVVGSPGRRAIKALLPKLQKEYGLDFTVVNAENAAGGSGITSQVAEELFACGVDVLTSGDHIWKKKEIFELLSAETRILRPANYPSGSPGSGYAAYKTRLAKHTVGVVNVNGRVFMPALDCPFKAVSAAVENLIKETRIILVDVHAEATSEKIAMGWYLDGKVSAVIGTHTHVQTADERILPQGTAYLSDAGMTGPCDSVIGRDTASVIERFLTCIPVKFDVAEENIQLQGAVVDVDESTGRARSIVRVQRKLNE